jgi:hypothetical protein
MLGAGRAHVAIGERGRRGREDRSGNERGTHG